MSRFTPPPATRAAHLSVIVTLAFLTSSCEEPFSHEPPDQVASDISGPELSHPPLTFDERLLQLSRDLPGFGGFFVGEGGLLHVWVVAQSTAAATDEATIRDLIADRLGREFRGVRKIVGPYSFAELFSWRRSARALFSRDDVVLLDIDEVANRLEVGITDLSRRDEVEELLTGAGVPLSAVSIIQASPIVPGATLRDRIRPVPGSVQIKWDAGSGAEGPCTIGFNAWLDSMAGFVTNAHCSGTQGFTEPTTSYHQNVVDGSANRVGYEKLDPPFFSDSLGCAADDQCRLSDANFVEYEDTTLWELGYLPEVSSGITIGSGKMRITCHSCGLEVVGDTVWKQGRTTGRTYAVVNQTCVDAVQGTPGTPTLLCQHKVLGPWWVNNFSHGDSGSPVFTLTEWDNDIWLQGIAWGFDGDYWFYSPMLNVESELGPLKPEEGEEEPGGPS